MYDLYDLFDRFRLLRDAKFWKMIWRIHWGTFHERRGSVTGKSGRVVVKFPTNEASFVRNAASNRTSYAIRRFSLCTTAWTMDQHFQYSQRWIGHCSTWSGQRASGTAKNSLVANSKAAGPDPSSQWKLFTRNLSYKRSWSKSISSTKRSWNVRKLQLGYYTRNIRFHCINLLKLSFRERISSFHIQLARKCSTFYSVLIL